MGAKWFFDILLQFQDNCRNVFGDEFFFAIRTQGLSEPIPTFSVLFCDDPNVIADCKKRGYAIKPYKGFNLEVLEELWAHPAHWDFEFYLFRNGAIDPALTFAFYSYLPGIEVKFNTEEIDGGKAIECFQFATLKEVVIISNYRLPQMVDNWDIPITDPRFDALR